MLLRYFVAEHHDAFLYLIMGEDYIGVSFSNVDISALI